MNRLTPNNVALGDGLPKKLVRVSQLETSPRALIGLAIVTSALILAFIVGVVCVCRVSRRVRKLRDAGYGTTGIELVLGQCKSERESRDCHKDI